MLSHGAPYVSDHERQDEWLFHALLQENTPAWMVAEGVSMWPAFRNGARILIDPTIPFSTIKVGELVLADTPRGLRCHRVIKRNKDTLVLKGDTRVWEDPPVTNRDVWGVVREVDQTPKRKRNDLVAAWLGRTIARISRCQLRSARILHRVGHTLGITRSSRLG